MVIACFSANKIVVKNDQINNQKEDNTFLGKVNFNSAIKLYSKKPISYNSKHKEYSPSVLKSDLETTFHNSYNFMLNSFVSSSGVVNYKGIIKQKGLIEKSSKFYIENPAQNFWSQNKKIAYWMNAYNFFTIKLIIDNYPVKSIKDIKNAWDGHFFKIGEKMYSLNDIEHKILRKMNDPRIHFGINCASFSCPPLLNKAFTPENVNKELDILAKRFINDKQRNNISENKIQLSKIFQWFGKDFKREGTLIAFLNKYADITINSNAKKTYLKYNWNLNE